MQTKLILSLAIIICQCLFCMVSGVCETEEDLDFEACDLKDLKDEVLKDICNRIGLDMESHVLPYIFDDDEGEKSSSNEGGDTTTTRKYTHEDFVRGAEECLLIEDEMDKLEEDDPDYLAQLEREALADEPEIVAEIVADVLKQDEKLLKEIASKLEKDTPETVKEMEGMLGGEKLENRPDVVGFVVAKLLSEDQNLDILDEFDAALTEHFGLGEEDSGDEEEEEAKVGGGDEL